MILPGLLHLLATLLRLTEYVLLYTRGACIDVAIYLINWWTPFDATAAAIALRISRALSAREAAHVARRAKRIVRWKAAGRL